MTELNKRLSIGANIATIFASEKTRGQVLPFA